MSDDLNPSVKAAIAAERKRCIGRVLTFAALRERVAADLDKGAAADGDEKPNEGGAARAQMQADVARDIATLLSEDSETSPRTVNAGL